MKVVTLISDITERLTPHGAAITDRASCSTNDGLHMRIRDDPRAIPDRALCTGEPEGPYEHLPIVVVLSLVTVEYGGWALPTFMTGHDGLADWQKSLVRAGHAHVGVLLVLSLVYLLYLPRADFSNALEWAAGGGLLAGVVAQSGGFVLRLPAGRPGESSAGTRLTRAGAALIAAALVTLAVGLIKTV